MNKLVNGVVVPLTTEEIAEVEALRAAAPSETDIKWQQIRNQRNRLLLETDWVVTKASDTGVAVSNEWKTYRQALRDVPTQSDPDNITWPTKPS
ncbi:MAG: hypothetical protein CMA50_01860 [Euryarchaeota archaeon]|nr:hypothetical protein [Euryarchaeota archaeon]|tara:strand:+ start:321 stop:602 length:282 start_codon:yes stop_codon:yes gene_type:complete